MKHRLGSRLFLVQLAATSICLGVLIAPVATAAATPAEITIARRMYAEAVRHEKANAWPQAEERLRRILEIKATPGIYFHLANSLQQQGRFVEALLNYDRARELIDSGVKADDVLRLLGPVEDELKARVANLTVVVTDPVGSLEVDGQDVGTSLVGASFPIDPGPHSIVIRTPDGRSFAQSFRAVEGQEVEITATFRAAPIVSAAPTPVKPGSAAPTTGSTASVVSPAPSVRVRESADTPWLGYVFAGGALAASGASLYGFLRADSKGAQAQTFAKQCAANNQVSCAESDTASDSRDAAIVLGIASAGVAVGFAALATWQFWPAPTADETGMTFNFATNF